MGSSPAWKVLAGPGSDARKPLEGALPRCPAPSQHVTEQDEVHQGKRPVTNPTTALRLTVTKTLLAQEGGRKEYRLEAGPSADCGEASAVRAERCQTHRAGGPPQRKEPHCPVALILPLILTQRGPRPVSTRL